MATIIFGHAQGGSVHLLATPRKYTLVAGAAEGRTRLNAFDNALLKAGLGNLNLLRVSSILPPGAERVATLAIPPGTLTPTAYGTITSEVEGERIAAAIGVGRADSGDYGVIMEFSGRCSRNEAEEAVRAMLEEAFETRGRRLWRVEIEAVEHRVERIGCAFAAAALWY
jgi:arginine decarboxylase